MTVEIDGVGTVEISGSNDKDGSKNTAAETPSKNETSNPSDSKDETPSKDDNSNPSDSKDESSVSSEKWTEGYY